MVLDQVFQHLGLRRKFLGRHRGSLNFRHHEIHYMVLFKCVVIKLLIGPGTHGRLESRIENLCLDGRMCLNLVFDAAKQVLLPAAILLDCGFQSLQQLANFLVIFL